ncbi:MAG TPA: hypothetical protein VKA21_14320, partial [Candidatus Binatia bacterium]|nr:hypothetical protein [Candidatus Binatia bacterium]
ARAAAASLARRGLGGGHLLPPNNARLLGDLIYLTDLERFDALAPTDGDLPLALRSVAAAGRTAGNPFGALATLAGAAERG